MALRQVANPPALELLATDACSLCEQALAVLLQLDALAGSTLDWIDIASAGREAELARYGSRIPVLRHVRSASELDWPFGDGDVRAWLAGLPP